MNWYIVQAYSNFEKKVADEIKKEEEALKIMQEELGSQRSILPSDEFT